MNIEISFFLTSCSLIHYFLEYLNFLYCPTENRTTSTDPSYTRKALNRAITPKSKQPRSVTNSFLAVSGFVSWKDLMQSE